MCVPLEAESLDGFMLALPALGLSGFSLAPSFEREALPFVQDLADEARATGTVDTITLSGDRLAGLSTSGRAVVAPLAALSSVAGLRIAVVGAGRIARSAVQELQARGALPTLFARNEEKASLLAAELEIAAEPLAALGERPWDVLINATPLGSAALPDQSPLAATAHRAESIVFDLVAEAGETPLLRDARSAGAQTIDGVQLLVARAAAQFEAWTGLDAPADVMEAAAYGAVARGKTS